MDVQVPLRAVNKKYYSKTYQKYIYKKNSIPIQQQKESTKNTKNKKKINKKKKTFLLSKQEEVFRSTNKSIGPTYYFCAFRINQKIKYF